MNDIGWIKIHRKLIDWEWYKDVNTFKLFMHLLLKANIETKKWQGLTINRGQLITSLKNLSHETGLTEKEVRTALSKLEKTKEVGKQSSSVNTTLTMLNYDLYQSMGKPTDKQGANKGQGKGKQGATTKEGEEDKEEKEDNIYTSFDHLSITTSDFNKLLELGHSESKIKDIFLRIQNYKNNSKYKSLYLTALNWLKDEKDKTENKQDSYTLANGNKMPFNFPL